MFIKTPKSVQLLLSHPSYWVRFARNVLLGIRCSSTLSKDYPEKTVKITQEIVNHLERVSLVDFANKKGFERLQSAIEFADQINHVITSGVEPMVSVLQNRCIYLRNDKVDDGNCRESVMANATVIEEEYFVAPPGNIPVTPSKLIFEEHRNAM